jgi:hypothetical protein
LAGKGAAETDVAEISLAKNIKEKLNKSKSGI